MAAGNFTDIESRLQAVHQRIAAAARKAGRDPAGIRLLAVSKGVGEAGIRQAIAAGQQLFGESYIQEALDKLATLANCPDPEWHFIGPIQRNKTQLIARHFDWVHGLDRLLIAERLNAQRDPARPLNVLIQINVSGEASKAGVEPAELDALVDGVLRLPHLRLRGLMALPSPDLTQASLQFGQMAGYFQSLRARCPDAAIDTLSMGMSDDLELAVAAGSTILRIGSAIFGPREYRRAAPD